ncbi:MAG: macro domain-containing protein [Planctomycetes bacterium]|nr:macro domain-containing protein [Planctomycetota bacterium]
MTNKLVVNGQAIELVQGDVTNQSVDAIVNAANSRLAGGAGVDGAIHDRGGPTIMAETRRRYPDGCPTGSAVISGAGELPASYVIHAVGPIWHGGESGEAAQLTSAHRRCLELAVENDCASIAFPAISTGVYEYPVNEAAVVALGTSYEFLHEFGKPSLIRFVLFSREALESFAAAFHSIDRS